MKTIGFFGDSYCSELKAEQGNKSFGTDWDTYIEIIRDRLNLEVVHLGQKGSSVWDLFLLQWKTFKENKSLPDICIFLWTDPYRLFSRDWRKISINPRNYFKIKNKEFRTSISNYYKFIFDEELAILQHNSALHFFDHKVLSKYKKNTKFIHLRSTYPSTFFTEEQFLTNSILPQATYSFKNGINFTDTLYDFYRDKQTLKHMGASNHIYGQENNEFLANKIICAINNYKNTTLSLYD